MIRPREGDFIYSEPELAVMRHDIEVARSLGAAGVVVGVLTLEGTIDREQFAALAALARPLSLTFHKAFDQTRDLLESLDSLIALGVDRVLTSGGRPTALEGVDNLARLVDHAAGRMAVMAGGRLAADNLETIIREAKSRRNSSRIGRQPHNQPASDGRHRSSARKPVGVRRIPGESHAIVEPRSFDCAHLFSTFHRD